MSLFAFRSPVSPRSSLLAPRFSLHGGFTLIELIIYVGVLVVVAVAMVNILPLLFSGKGNIEARQAVREQLGFSVERIAQDVRAASAVMQPPNAGETGEYLLVTHPTDGNVSYCVTSNVLRRAVQGALCNFAAPALTSPTVTVAAPSFTRVVNTNTQFGRTTVAIQLSLAMTAGDAVSGEQYTETMRTTVTMRP